MRRVQPWLPALAWAALIFAFSAQPTLPVDLELGNDKLAHLLAYGASDEWHQSFVPGRSVDVADWIADAIGVVVGVLFYHWLRRRAWRSASPVVDARTDSTPS